MAPTKGLFDPAVTFETMTIQLGSVSGKDLGHDSWLKYSSDAPVIELVARLRGRGKTTDVDSDPSMPGRHAVVSKRPNKNRRT
jgi:hypothetical protein